MHYAIRNPKTTPLTASVRDMLTLFDDDHVHMALLTHDGYLRGCVTRSDLTGAPPDALAVSIARQPGRTIASTQLVDAAWDILERTGARRLAVVDNTARLVGLLCLKRSGTGFCSDEDVSTRSAELNARSATRRIESPADASARSWAPNVSAFRRR